MSFESLRLIAVLMMALVCIYGCGDGGDAAKDAAANLKDAAGKKASDLVAKGFDELKGKYLETAKATLGEIGKKIDGLVDQKKALPEAAQKALEGPMEDLLASRDNAEKKFSEVEKAGEDNFEEKRSELDSALGELKNAFTDVASKFK